MNLMYALSIPVSRSLTCTHLYTDQLFSHFNITQMQGLTGPPDRHRRASRAGHAGKWPILMYLSLISYSKLVSEYFPSFPRSYVSFRTYSRCVSRQGDTGPFHYPPPHLKRPRLTSEAYTTKDQEERWR